MREGFVVTGLSVSGDVCTCTAVPQPDALFFDGHFPGDPVLPAVAQLSALVEPVAQHAWLPIGAPLPPFTGRR